MKRKIILLFALVFMISIVSTSFALAVTDIQDAKTLKMDISILENSLENDGTNVVHELEQLILYYQNALVKETNPEEQDKLRNLIKTTRFLIHEYQNKDSDVSLYGNFHILIYSGYC